ARLLAELERNAKPQPPLDELERRHWFAAHDARRRLEALELRGLVARSVDDRPRMERRGERLEEHRLAPLHADGAELDRQDVAEAVDDETRYAVALGVNEAEAGGAVDARLDAPLDTALALPARQAEGRAKRLRRFEPLPEELGVNLRRGVAHEEPHRDRRSRGKKDAPEQNAAGIGRAHFVAGCRTLFDGVNRLRVHPRVPRPDRLHMTWFEPDRRHGPAHSVNRHGLASTITARA